MRLVLVAALCLAAVGISAAANPPGSSTQHSPPLVAGDRSTGIVGLWPMDEGGGSVLLDISGQGNNANITGSPAWVPGVDGLALRLSGTGQYATAPANPTLDMTSAITLAMWVRPERIGIQDLIKKAFNNSIDGYELALSGTSSSWPQRAYVRFNQKTWGDTYRVNSVTLYPYDGVAWIHLAATYDGSVIRLYVNGLQEGPPLAMPVPIATNSHPLSIGAQTDGSRATRGSLDGVRLYDRALDAVEVEALASHTIVASAGPGGAIDPSGDVLVRHTSSRTFTITPDDCHTIGDVVVDGVSVGPVPSYTFNGVITDHTITATFTVKTNTITASAGPGGSISPSGNVVVDCGSDQPFTITPESAHFRVLDVLVDGLSVGAVPVYSFFDVVADHTIEASFAVVLDEVTPIPPPGIVISPMNPCVAIPFYFTRPTDTPIRGYSVTVELSADLLLCGPEVVTGGYTLPPRSLQVTPQDGNRWVIDEVTLGSPCGVTGSGTIFTLYVTAANHTCGTGTITVVAALARDCMNLPVVALAGPAATIDYDMCGPAVTADLTAVQVKSGNYVPPPGSNGTTMIQLNYSLPPDAAGVEIYRKGYGGYPQYDENEGAPPMPPSYPPDASWTLTGVTASGQTDAPPTRDFWFYVLFSKDQYGNLSAVSNRTNGTLGYHLGDVSDGYVQGQGDDLVDTADISLLGTYYGIALPLNDPGECVDVGPTTDGSPDARPMTDNLIQFEDLVIFALNYGEVSKQIAKPPAASTDELTVNAPASVEEGAVIDAALMMRGTGLVQALSVTLGFDPQVVEPIGTVRAGDLLTMNGGIALSPRSGTVDAAVLGVVAGGLMGEGELAAVRFHAIASGNPRIIPVSVDARDSKNRIVHLDLVGAAESNATKATDLLPPSPNPSTLLTMLRYRLASSAGMELAIYSVDGRLVRVLDIGTREAGEHDVVWDGTDGRGQRAPSGQYYARFRTQNLTRTRQLTLLR